MSPEGDPSYDELLAERNELWAELQRRAAVDRELQDQIGVVRYMEASASWRLTAPLRAGKRVAEKVRRRLQATR